MPFSLTTGEYNVVGSLFAWLAGQITANAPAAITTPRIVVDLPEQPLVAPEWSLHWLGTLSDPPFQGGHVDGGLHGDGYTGLVEINCWVTRQMTGWAALLAQMSDTLYKTISAARAAGSAVIIRDFYTNANAPAATANRVTLGTLEPRTPPFDPNPDIERRRFILTVQWIMRS